MRTGGAGGRKRKPVLGKHLIAAKWEGVMRTATAAGSRKRQKRNRRCLGDVS